MLEPPPGERSVSQYGYDPRWLLLVAKCSSGRDPGDPVRELLNPSPACLWARACWDGCSRVAFGAESCCRLNWDGYADGHREENGIISLIRGAAEFVKDCRMMQAIHDAV